MREEITGAVPKQKRELPLLHITGASGSGTTTLGLAVARALGLPHFEADDYIFVPTDPPFTQPRRNPDRVRLLRADLRGHAAWVLSGGALYGWGPWTKTFFTHVVFLDAPTAVRLERLRRRDRETYGDDALPGGRMHPQLQRLLRTAAAYDRISEGPTRNREWHEAWLAKLACPVLRLSGELPTAHQVAAVLRALGYALAR